MPQGSGVHAKTTKPRRCSSCQSAIVSVGRAAGAVEAGRLGGIEFQALHRDPFAAGHAIAVVPGLDALQSGLDTLQLQPPSPLRLQEQDLVLQSLHARLDEHTSELPSLMCTQYAVFCIEKQKRKNTR